MGLVHEFVNPRRKSPTGSHEWDSNSGHGCHHPLPILCLTTTAGIRTVPFIRRNCRTSTQQRTVFSLLAVLANGQRLKNKMRRLQDFQRPFTLNRISQDSQTRQERRSPAHDQHTQPLEDLSHERFCEWVIEHQASVAFHNFNDTWWFHEGQRPKSDEASPQDICCDHSSAESVPKGAHWHCPHGRDNGQWMKA